MKLCMIGTGYVGLVSGVCFSDLGNTVYCVDNDIEKIILDYNNVDLEQKKKEQEMNMTNNQKIFKSIRDFF